MLNIKFSASQLATRLESSVFMFVLYVVDICHCRIRSATDIEILMLILLTSGISFIVDHPLLFTSLASVENY